MIDFNAFIVDEMESTPEEIAPLYQIYLQEMNDMIDALKEAAFHGDRNSFKRTLHNIKGISANLRIEPVLKPITPIYQKLKDDEAINLDQTLSFIIEIFEETQIEITTFFNF